MDVEGRMYPIDVEAWVEINGTITPNKIIYNRQVHQITKIYKVFEGLRDQNMAISSYTYIVQVDGWTKKIYYNARENQWYGVSNSEVAYATPKN